MKTDCQIIHGDCRVELAKLPAKSVHMCVTSPPYWGLRKYQGVEPSVWGGDAECVHEWGEEITKAGQSGGYQTGHTVADSPHTPPTVRVVDSSSSQFCRRCSAWRGLLGLEPNVDCGQRGLLKLRADLTDAQREYVVQRLSGVIPPGADRGDTRCKALRHSTTHSVKKGTAPKA